MDTALIIKIKSLYGYLWGAAGWQNRRVSRYMCVGQRLTSNISLCYCQSFLILWARAFPRTCSSSVCQVACGNLPVSVLHGLLTKLGGYRHVIFILRVKLGSSPLTFAQALRQLNDLQSTILHLLFQINIVVNVSKRSRM